YDRNERRSYELTRVVAARLVDDPSLVKIGLDFVSRRARLDRAAGEAIALAAETNGDPVALMAAASGTDAKYCDPVIRAHPLFCSALRARFLMPEERARLEHEARMAAAAAAEPGPVVWVRRQFNNRRSRRAAYRIADVTGLHWASRSGGKQRRVSRPYLHGCVWCDAMITASWRIRVRTGRRRTGSRSVSP